MAVSRVARALGGRRIPRWVWWLLSAKLIAVAAFLVLVGVAVVGIFAAGGGTLPGFGRSSSACPAGSPPGGQPVAVTGTAPGLAADQLANAQAIAGVALGLGLGRPGVLVGILTADVETDLHNDTFGDIMANGLMSSSRGLFQQLDAWGPLADRLDPAKAATMFYTGGAAGQRGLVQVPGWQGMDPGVAMQAVQGSQFAGGSSPGYAGKLAQATAATDALMAGQPVAPVSGPTTAVIAPLPAAPLPGRCGPPAAGAPPAAGTVPVVLNGPVVTIPNDPNVAVPLRGLQVATGAPGVAKGLAAGFAVLGMPYVWGGGGDGAGPNNGCARGGGALNSCGSTIGFDCSGLTAYVIVQGGFPDPGGNSGAQAQPAHAVPWAQGAPGDLIVFPGHVAVFLGVVNGTPYILEASDVGIPIHVVPLTRTDHGPSMYRYWS